MSIAGKWGYSFDEETYTGPFESKEEALLDAGERRPVYVGVFRDPILEQAFNAEDIMDQILCQDDYCGDWADSALECTKEQHKELTNDLRRAFLLWVGRHDLEPKFGLVDDPEKITE